MNKFIEKLKQLKLNTNDIEIIENYSNCDFGLFLNNFSFSSILKHFNNPLSPLKTNFYFMIHSDSSIALQNKELGIEKDLISEIIDLAYSIKSSFLNSNIYIYLYIDYVIEITEINNNVDKQNIINNIIQQKFSSKSDILMSLSNLLTKISINSNNIKNNFIQIISINNNKNSLEKIFNLDDLKKILKEFIDCNNDIEGIEFKYLSNNNLYFMNNIYYNPEYLKITDYNPKASKTIIEHIKSISIPNLFKALKLSNELKKIFDNFLQEETVKNAIECFDNFISFLCSIYNSIEHIKFIIENNNKAEEIKDKFKKMLENEFSTSEKIDEKLKNILPENIFNGVLNSIKETKEILDEIKINDFEKEIQKIKGLNQCLFWKKIIEYLNVQREGIETFFYLINEFSLIIGNIENKIIQNVEKIIN